MSKAIWTNGKGEQIVVNVLGASMIRAGFVMVQKATAQPGHGIFSVCPSKLVAVQEHTTSRECWCEPYVDYIDPDTGVEVWVHRGEIQ